MVQNTNMNSADKSLRILILTREFYPLYVGGLGVLVKDLTTELKNQGSVIDICLPFVPKNLNIDHKSVINLEKGIKKHLRNKAVIPGYPIKLDKFKKQTDNYKKNWEFLYRDSSTKPAHATTIYPNDLPRLTRAYGLAFIDFFKNNKERYDIILAMDWHVGPAVYLIKKHFPSFPVIAYFNATHFDRKLSLKYKKTDKDIEKIKQEKIVTDLSDHIVTVSQKQADMINEMYEIPYKKITPVFNDIIFNPTKKKIKLIQKEKVVLNIGRVSGQKGLSFLIETAEKLVITDPDIKIIIAGDGDSLPFIINKVLDAGLERNVFFTGWVNMDEKKQLYASSSLFVMPSPSEPFGLTALEAIKSGVPVIASENSGFVDIVKSTPVFPYYDSQKFADMVRFYLNHKEESNKLLKMQQNDLSLHSWSKEVSKLIKLCQEIIQK